MFSSAVLLGVFRHHSESSEVGKVLHFLSIGGNSSVILHHSIRC